MNRKGYALEIAYIGTRFSGFARQPGRRTVEALLSRALAEQEIAVPLSVAGRTDAGVHARRQVVSFRTRGRFDPERLRAALSSEPDLRLLRIAPVGPSFHARASVVSRRYVYRLRIGGPPSRFRCILPEQRYDWDAAAAFLAQQLGTQDRRGFTYRPTRTKETTLTEATLQTHGRRVVVSFVGDGYTRHLVRNWMAEAIAVAGGTELPKRGAHGFSGRPAPPEGLCLWSVEYGDVPFSWDG